MLLKHRDLNKMIFLLVFLLSISADVFTQEKYGFININTEPSGALVYIDSTFVGRSPLINMKIKSGTYTLNLKYPKTTDWLEKDIVQKIEVKENDTLNLFISFEKLIKINSIPFSADIFLGDSIIGTTPTIFKMKDLLGKSLKIRKKGYGEVEVFIDGGSRNIEVSLPQQPGAESELRTKPKDRLKSVLPIAGLSLASGAVSVYFKMQADKLYGEYLKTGDPEKLNTVKTYDKVAGVTLLIFELTTIVAIYILLKE